MPVFFGVCVCFLAFGIKDIKEANAKKLKRNMSDKSPRRAKVSVPKLSSLYFSVLS